ncbi:hypothetical protein LI328DRAFT_135130 [Trichoderma asperelloides]|nr:hypothetical protein LI328DRAFT_135130 [Trichoderma asperelloides]
MTFASMLPPGLKPCFSSIGVAAPSAIGVHVSADFGGLAQRLQCQSNRILPDGPTADRDTIHRHSSVSHGASNQQLPSVDQRRRPLSAAIDQLPMALSRLREAQWMA